MQGGRNYHPTALLHIANCFWNDETREEFSLFIVKRALDKCRNDSIKKIAGRNTVRDLEDCVATMEAYLLDRDEASRLKLSAMEDEFAEFQPYGKRVWVHATRRKVKCMELFLAEYAILLMMRGGTIAGYSLAKYYVYDYLNLRFRVGRESSSRLGDIIEFLRAYENANGPFVRKGP